MGTTKVGKYARRIIVPSFDTSGELNFFVARTIDKKNSYKYINAPVDKKSIILYTTIVNVITASDWTLLYDCNCINEKSEIQKNK